MGAIGTEPAIWLSCAPVGVIERNADSMIGHPSKRDAAVIVNEPLSAYPYPPYTANEHGERAENLPEDSLHTQWMICTQ
jgi:hypothetical protein